MNNRTQFREDIHKAIRRALNECKTREEGYLLSFDLIMEAARIVASDPFTDAREAKKAIILDTAGKAIDAFFFSEDRVAKSAH